MTENQEPPERHAEGRTEVTAGQATRQERRDDRVRGRLREVEAERDMLRAQRDQLVQAEVTRMLSEYVVDIDVALRAGGKVAGDFVDTEGRVDAEAVQGFAADLVDKVPGFGVPRLPTLSGASQHKVSAHEVLHARRDAGWPTLLAGGSRGEG